MASKEDIKMILEIQQQAYKNALEVVMSDVSNRMRELERRNHELVHSLEFTQHEVKKLATDNCTLKEEITTLKKELKNKTDVEEKLTKINNRLDYHEDYSRRLNLRFDGMEEKPNETWEVSQDAVQRLLRDKLSIGSVQLERAHRVGPKSSRPRTIVARFTNFEDRQLALRNAVKLKNTNIYINEDLCESSVQLRKAQLPDLKKARMEGKIAYFSHTKLIVRERREQQTDSLRTADQTTVSPASDASVAGAPTAAAPQAPPQPSSVYSEQTGVEQREETSGGRSVRQKKSKK